MKTRTPQFCLRTILTASVLGFLGGAPALAGTDVTPGQTGFEPNNAVVNPLNPSQVAVMRGCQVRISNDFGQTYPIIRNSTLRCSGDPSMAFDSQGRLIVSHLSRIVMGGELRVFAGQIADITTPGTQTFTPNQVSATDTRVDDKQWLVADANPASPFRDNLYIVWSQDPQIPAAATTQILFSMSTDQGANWTPQQPISAAGEGFVWPAHIAVAANGDVYVAYHTNACGGANAGTIPLLVDGNGGANFAMGVVPQKNLAFGAGQATVSCNVQDSSGDEIPGADFWLQGSLQPWILPDPLFPENVYVIANDDPDNTHGSGDDADVVIARSNDFGVTFTRSRVDNGPGQSFAVMPTAHIDQDGNIAVHWYDNRRGLMNLGTFGNNNNPNFLLDLYGTASFDGGVTFVSDFRINDAPFDPDWGLDNMGNTVGSPCRFGSRAGNNCTERIGEYNGIWTVDGIGYATWTGNATPPPGPFPSDGAGAQTTYFDLFSMHGAVPDRLEPNESRDFAVVAALGADNTYNEPKLSLHTATDVDFFKVIALHTGKLEVEIEFNELIADLEVQVQDGGGNVVATGTMTTLQPGSSVEMLAIPVVQGENYFVEVFDPNAPNTFAPQSLYDLTIINRPAPVPFGLDLRASSDTGFDDSDDVTADNTPTIQLRVDDVDFLAMGIDFSPTPDGDLSDDSPGFKVRLFDNGNPAGFADQVGGQPGVYVVTPSSPIVDGTHSFTARVVIVDPSDPITPDHAVGQGAESDSLLVTIDTAAPAAPANPPDLLPSSDSAGIDIDNITTIMAAAFQGTAEANGIVRVRADGVVVGEGTAGSDATAGDFDDGLGAWEITVEPLADGVYQITAEVENTAGLISDPSDALQVTIANQILNLAGASGAVAVDLDASTLTGYPGIPGGVVGILGIPQVNLDVSSNALSILGTPGPDALVYSPTGSEDGNLTRASSSQVINFSSVAGGFSIDPLGSSDALTVRGTVESDTILVVANPTTTVQVNALLTVEMPIANAERVIVLALEGEDQTEVQVPDSVNAHFEVHGGTPTSNQRLSDRLEVVATSSRPRLHKQPGGGVKGSGSIFVGYPRTTGNETRVDYVDVEKVSTSK